MNSTFYLKLMFVFTVLASCNDKIPEKQSVFEGIWQSEGYGWILEIENDTYNMYDITKISCIPFRKGSLSDFAEKISAKNDTLRMKKGINLYSFSRLELLPKLCSEEVSESQRNDPEYNFEVYWNTFNDHYAFFELREVNWNEMYKIYRPKISSETTPVELYLILKEMLDTFHDGHVEIDASEAVYEALKQPEITSEEKTIRSKIRPSQVAESIANHYFKEINSRKKGFVRWGILDGNLGYLQINQMMMFADYTISDTLKGNDYWMKYFELAEESNDDLQDEVDGINQVLNEAMSHLNETRAMILDVRFNGGGKDSVGLAIMSCFNDQQRVAFTKKARNGNGFSKLNKISLYPASEAYSKRLYLLTSAESASATEIMILSSMNLPNITRIGGETEGVFSDVLDKVLPNGWELGLSNEVYQTMDGVNYEGKGIPPHIDLKYSRLREEFLGGIMDSLDLKGDSAIEKVFELMNLNN